MDHVTTWVFDLDNTLYAPSARLFDQIEARVTDWVMQKLRVTEAEADRLRSDYWHQYGATLSGLMERHSVDPHDYLAHVHDISLSGLSVDTALAGAIRALPGRKLVFTNGSRRHAERVTEARGLSGVFDALYGIEDAGFRPKPERAAFDQIVSLAGIDPQSAAMFEDDPRNLRAPHDLGMACVLVGTKAEPAPHIHHYTDDLTGFLAARPRRA